MTGHQLRQQYLNFFQERDSLIIPSSSLVPTDPTTLLTSAGMQPLVPYFKGEETPPRRRLTSCQKCCRTDDFEQVGVTWRHASFFEMLGNFSFGDYFKRDAIIWGWEFLTKTLGIDPDVLWVSVYFDDPEAPEFWKKDVGLSDERIYRFDKKDNWWGPVGASGPCGPDSEIFFDRGAKYDTGDPEMDRPGGDGDRYGEIWNLVFQQYNQREDGVLEALPAPGIDTGMGLERTAAVLQGVDTIHHTDLFAPIVRAIDELRRGKIQEFSTAPLPLDPQDPDSKPLKVVADHIRAAVFLGADGITPGNTGRDYMMRRLIRRAVSSGRALGYDKPFLNQIVPAVAHVYGDIYPEIRQRETVVTDMIRREEERFGATIEGGWARLEDLLSDLKDNTLSGAEAFRLYETYGFPRELTQEIAAERGVSIDEEGYRAAAEKHSKISGSAVGAYETRNFGDAQTEFVGYEMLEADAQIIAAKEGPNSTVLVVLDKSPFYAESGGQSGDTGTLTGEGFSAKVVDTQKQGKAWIHTLEVQEGEAREGLSVHASVDATRRNAIQRAHSATHLLHKALRETLGTHVEQRGSLVSPDKLRFDFVHFGPMTPEEMAQVEDKINADILASHGVEIREMSLDQARGAGAMALFSEKYGDTVRTVKMGESFELCGGTHLQNTASAGLLRLLSEGGISANVRRIEALTGNAALLHDRGQVQTLKQTAQSLGVAPDAAPATAEKLRARVKELEKQIQQAQRERAASSLDELLANAQDVAGLKLVAARAPEGLDADALRDLVGKAADKADVVVLAAENGGKVVLAVKASKDAVAKGAHAGNLVRELAKMTGGGGGGKPDFAQAGGKDVTQIDAALAAAQGVLESQLGG
ncbi:MAG TPA: alanine--tRNA ligase [Abditibacteriaceae bacterium]|jgi:alanyl-tRNA synthetase